MPDISVVIVNHNSGHQLKECVDSLLCEISDLRAEVLIVDNASDDDGLDFLRDAPYDKIKVIRNSRAMGYGYAANRGFKASGGRYVLFSNPDMIVVKDTVRNMIKHMENAPLLGAVSGYYLKPDGSFDRFYNTFPTVQAMLLLQLPNGIASRFSEYRRYNMSDVDFMGGVVVDQPSGAFLLLRRELFNDELISPEFNMYFTDVDICRKIYLAGKKIKVFDDCPVIHKHIINSRFTSDIKNNYPYILDYFAGMAAYFKRFGGNFKWIQVRMLFLSILFLSSLYYPIKALLAGEDLFTAFKYRLLIFWFYLSNRNFLSEERDRRTER